MGSVSFAGNGSSVAITSPRGGVLLTHDLTKGTKIWNRSDICGVAPSGEGFVSTDGLGGIFSVVDGKPRKLALANRAWDNHLVAI